jgi:fructokinase
LVLHTGSIATALEPGCDAVAELIDANAATSTMSFDPNIRSAFFEDAEQALSRVETVVARSDVVKASDEDMRWLDPHSSPEELAARWLTLGPSIVAVTFGAHGSFAICADGDERIPAYPAEVVDTVGAGDAFMTGLIDALWDLGLLGRTPARPTARHPCGRAA